MKKRYSYLIILAITLVIGTTIILNNQNNNFIVNYISSFLNETEEEMFSEQLKNELGILAKLFNDNEENAKEAIKKWLDDDELEYYESVWDHHYSYLRDEKISDSDKVRMIKDDMYVLTLTMEKGYSFENKIEVSKALLEGQVIKEDLVKMIDLFNKEEVTNEEIVQGFLEIFPDLYSEYTDVLYEINEDDETVETNPYMALRKELMDTREAIAKGTYVEDTKYERYIKTAKAFFSAVNYTEKDKIDYEAKLKEWLKETDYDTIFSFNSLIADLDVESIPNDKLDETAINLFLNFWYSIITEQSTFVSFADYESQNALLKGQIIYDDIINLINCVKSNDSKEIIYAIIVAYEDMLSNYKKCFNIEEETEEIKYENKYQEIRKGLLEESYSSWEQLQSAFDGNGKNNKYFEYSISKDIINIKLNSDIEYGKNTIGALIVQSNKKIVLDLNGYKIDRGLYGKSSENNGNIITVNGYITIKDTSSKQTGVLTGGNATYGGAIYNNGTFTMTGGAIRGNNVSINGGGIFANGTNAKVFLSENAIIEENNAGTTGGGVYVAYGAELVVSDNVLFKNNRSNGTSIYGGGAIYIYSNNDANRSLVTMNGGTITNNYSSYGGAVYSDKGDFIMTGGTIKENTANNAGGGLYFNNGGIITMSGGYIKENTASTGGGVFIFTDSKFIMTGGNISQNKANNKEKSGAGVIIYAEKSEFIMTGGTISENMATKNGGGVLFMKGTLKLGKNAVITNNKNNCPERIPVCDSNVVDNIYIYDGKQLTFLEGDDAPTSKMNIGITLQTLPETSTIISTNKTDNYKNIITLNFEGYNLRINKDNKVEVAKPIKITMDATLENITYKAYNDSQAEDLVNTSKDEKTLEFMVSYGDKITFTFTPSEEYMLVKETEKTYVINSITEDTKVSIPEVKHIHNLNLQEGLAPTYESSGYKSYYKCRCGKLFEDAEGKVEITDFNTWISATGAGYLDKLKEPGKFVTNTNNDDVNISSLALEKIIPLTETEKELMQKGENISVDLRINTSTSASVISKEDQELISNNLGKNTLAMYLDVSLFKKVGSNNEEKLSLLTSNLELSFKLSPEYINTNSKIARTYKVIRVHESEVTLLDAKFDEDTNTLTFETDRFSSYGLLYLDTPIPENPKTADNIITYILIGLISIIILGSSIIYIKKRSL